MAWDGYIRLRPGYGAIPLSVMGTGDTPAPRSRYDMKSRWQRDGRALSEWMLGQTEQSGSLMRCDCMTMSKYPPNNSMKADSSSGQVGVYKQLQAEMQ